MIGQHINTLRCFLRASRGRGVSASAAAYAAALGAAAGAVLAARPDHPLAVLGLGTLVATCVIFCVSMLVDNSSIYDPYWSLQPLAFVAYYLNHEEYQVGPRQILVAVLVFLYAVRLTSNFYRDWPGLRKEDFRYVEFRRRAGRAYWAVSFLGIHLFPTVAVYLGCLPLYGIFAAGRAQLTWLDTLGAVVVAAAVALAFVADEQLRTFRKRNSSRRQVMREGLWRYSRHPNYLGEILTWWGLWLMALGASLRYWWTICGAVVITLLFVTISVPLMEKRLLLTRPCYANYRRVTPALLPVHLPLPRRGVSSGGAPSVRPVPCPEDDQQAESVWHQSSE